jgi:hypothetical protein
MEPTKQTTIMQVLEAGALYFALAFAVGFVLGAVRTIWIVPRIGARRAELMEMPIMLVVTIVAARWTVLRLAVPPMLSARIGRDPVAGAAYYLLLIVFAIMPLVVGRR